MTLNTTSAKKSIDHKAFVIVWKVKMKKLLVIYWTFFKMGAVCFGGGYAMLPILERELVKKRGWTTKENLIDYYAIGQCTPGVIAVNTSTFVGNEIGGIFGGIMGTLGFITPSIIIITLIAALLSNFAHIDMVQRAFGGIRICVCALMFMAVAKLWKSAVKDMLGTVIFIMVAGCSVFLDISPVIYVILAATVGIIADKIKSTSKE